MSLTHNTSSILLPKWLKTLLNVQCQSRTHVSRNIVDGFRHARVLTHPWHTVSNVSSLPKQPLGLYLLLADNKVQYSPTVVIMLHHLGLFSGLLKNVIVLSLGRIYHLCFIRAFLLLNKLFYFYVQYCKWWGDDGKLQEQSNI